MLFLKPCLTPPTPPLLHTQTALKSLITIHRLMAETDEGVWEEINRVGAPARGRGPLGVDNFIDTTNIEGRFDFSEFVRAYGKYLDEQLRLYAAVRWTCSAVAAGGPGAGAPGGESAAGYGAAGYGAPPGPADAQRSPGGTGRFRTLPAAELLHQLPLLQRLQRHLVDCVPRGAATHDPVALASFSVLFERGRMPGLGAKLSPHCTTLPAGRRCRAGLLADLIPGVWDWRCRAVPLTLHGSAAWNPHVLARQGCTSPSEP